MVDSKSGDLASGGGRSSNGTTTAWESPTKRARLGLFEGSSSSSSSSSKGFESSIRSPLQHHGEEFNMFVESALSPLGGPYFGHGGQDSPSHLLGSQGYIEPPLPAQVMPGSAFSFRILLGTRELVRTVSNGGLTHSRQLRFVNVDVAVEVSCLHSCFQPSCSLLAFVPCVRVSVCGNLLDLLLLRVPLLSSVDPPAASLLLPADLLAPPLLTGTSRAPLPPHNRHSSLPLPARCASAALSKSAASGRHTHTPRSAQRAGPGGSRVRSE